MADTIVETIHDGITDALSSIGESRLSPDEEYVVAEAIKAALVAGCLLSAEITAEMVERGAECSYLLDATGHDIGWDGAPDDIKDDYRDHVRDVLVACLPFGPRSLMIEALEETR